MKLLISAFSCAPNSGSELGVGWNWTTEAQRLGHEVCVLVCPAHRDAIASAVRQDAALKEIRWVFPELAYWPVQQGKEPKWSRPYNLLWQKAAALYDAGDDAGAGEYANMAKYAAGEVACNATDAAVHTHGGNGLTVEYGLANQLVAARLGRIAPVSREMILNYIAMHTLGLPKSY